MSNLKIKSKNLELLILQCSVNNLSFFMKIKSYLDTSTENQGKTYFDDEKYQTVFNLYCRFFDKHKKQPKKKTFLLLVEAYSSKTKQEEDIALYLNNIADQMYTPLDLEEEDMNEIEEQTLSFIKENRVYESMLSSQRDMESGNYESIVTKMEEAVRISFDKDLGMSIRDFEDVFEKMEGTFSSQKVISTGYPNLDNFMDGGFYGSELYIIAGTPGTGKSLISANFAINAFLEGHNVLVYTFEMSDTRFYSRIFSNLTNYTKKEMLLDSQGAKDKLINNILNNTQGDLIIKEYNAHGASSNDLMSHIHDLSMYKGWKPDIIISDYLLLMSTNDRTRNRDDSYKYFKTVAEELRNIGKTLDLPVISPSQVNREGMADRGGTKSVITAKDISESRGIFDTAEFYASIIQTTKQKENGKLHLLNNKNRNGSTDWRLEFEVDYEHMKLKEGAVIS